MFMGTIVGSTCSPELLSRSVQFQTAGVAEKDHNHKSDPENITIMAYSDSLHFSTRKTYKVCTNWIYEAQVMNETSLEDF